MNTLTTNLGQRLTLADGRTLGYAEFGSPTGKPILLFNGSGSRLFYPFDDAVAQTLNARIITVERPGFGLSDFKPARTLLDWAEDVRQLADALGLEKFAVAGGSAGGPYAAVCAYKLPERITAVTLISSLAPFDIPDIANGMTPEYKLTPVLVKYAPWLLTLAQFFLIRNPAGAWEQFYARLPECDKATLRAHPQVDMQTALVRDVPEIYRSGSRGVLQDMKILTGSWGFSPAAIRVKTYLWQGERDANVPLNMGRYLARTIPNCRAHFLPNEGHLASMHHWPEIVAALVAEEA